MQIYTIPPIVQSQSCPQIQTEEPIWPSKSDCENFFENKNSNYMTFVKCVAEVADQHLNNKNNVRFMLSGNATSTVSSGTAVSGTTTTTTI